MNKSIFHFMNKDNIVATFTISNIEGVEVFGDFSWIAGKLPFGMTSIERWVNDRNVLIDKKHAKAMMKELGIETAMDFIDFTNCTSLFDSYWIKREDSKLSWANVSLYRNDFSEYLAHFAMNAEISGVEKRKRHLSPEYNTSGSFDHCWMKHDGKIFMLKAGSYGAANTGREPFSEVYVNQLAKALEISEYVEYKLQHLERRIPKTTKIVDIAVTRCDIITNEDVGMVDALCLGITSYEQLIDYCRTINEDETEKANDMLLLDCLSLNTDRHLGNVSMLVNNDTQEVLGIAPVYDNNMALIPMYMPEFDDIHDYTDGLLSSTDMPFDELFELCFNNTRDKQGMIDRLEKVKQGFHFEYIPFDEKLFPESRLLELETLVKERAGHFKQLALHLHDRDNSAGNEEAELHEK